VSVSYSLKTNREEARNSIGGYGERATTVQGKGLAVPRDVKKKSPKSKGTTRGEENLGRSGNEAKERRKKCISLLSRGEAINQGRKKEQAKGGTITPCKEGWEKGKGFIGEKRVVFWLPEEGGKEKETSGDAKPGALSKLRRSVSSRRKGEEKLGRRVDAS